MRRLLVTALMAMTVTIAGAQTDNEYRMEIGGAVGTTTYEGDFNGNILKGMQPSATVIARYLFNPYSGLRMTATYGKLKGDSSNNESFFNDYADKPYEFNKTLVDVGIAYEYNFWPYGTGHDYRGAKRITPFIFAGIGATYATGGDSNVFTGNVPMGLGVKYKIAERLNAAVEWAAHFSLSDKLDGCADPYGVKSSGLFKNTDCYSVLQISLTYSFMAKCRTCHNDDE